MNIDNTLLGTILMLFMGHFTGDFVLQNDRIAVEKCPGSDVTLPWFWWMIAHSACHCLLYTSPSPRDLSTSRMPSSA